MAHPFFALASFACVFGIAACAPAARLPPSSPSPRQKETSATDPPPRTFGPAQKTPDPSFEERDSRQLGRTWGWVAVGVGASAAVLALGTSWAMLDDLSRRNANCDSSKICTSLGASANDGLSSLAPVNTTSLIVAGAGLGVGTILLLTHPTDTSKGMQIGVVPTAGGMSVGARGSF